MKAKYLIIGLVAFFLSLGWNIFLIRRDQKLFDAYNQPSPQQVICKSEGTCKQ